MSSSENMLSVAEMRILKQRYGKTGNDKIVKDYIKGTVEVTQVKDIAIENLLKWYRHVQLRSNEGGVLWLVLKAVRKGEKDLR